MKLTVEQDTDGTPILVLSEVYSGIGIRTDKGLFGIAQRDGGIEVLLNGKTVWPEPTDPPEASELPEGQAG